MLDDITRAGISQGWGDCLQRVIDDRVENKGGTLITTMDKGTKLGLLFGKAFQSRLNRFKWIIILGNDRRQQARREKNQRPTNPF